jgi:hypothetical protein
MRRAGEALTALAAARRGLVAPDAGRLVLAPQAHRQGLQPADTRGEL